MTVEEQMLMNTLSKECERLHKELQRQEGRWIKQDKEFYVNGRLSPITHSIYECSLCHKKYANLCIVNFCPNCGARMKGEEE